MIKLAENTYSIIPEGTTIFKILEVNYDSDFGKMEISMATSEGKKHVERFSLINNNGTSNDGALKAFSFFARSVMNDSNISELEESAMVGKFLEAKVSHTKKPNRNDPTKTVTFLKLSDYAPASGFDKPKKVDIDF